MTGKKSLDSGAIGKPRSGCQGRANQAEAGMKRVLRFIVWLYPAPWRQRYGAEFVQNEDGQTATLSAYRSELTDVIGQALSQESLLAIMEKENLYQTERANKPMDHVINKMRQSVRIVA